MKKICVVTGSRAEYGLLKPLLQLLKDDDDVDLRLLVTGSHTSPYFGHTVDEIRNDGFNIDREIDILLSSDKSSAIVKSMGMATFGFCDAFTEIKPDFVILLGDRYEMFSVASVAFMLRIPIAHISGGDITEGAYDDVLRHCITKLSLLHFTTSEEARDRVIQLGEDPDRVYYLGNIALDSIASSNILSKEQLFKKLEIEFDGFWALITFHPVTLEVEKTNLYITNLLTAVTASGVSAIFTGSNADDGGYIINQALKDYCNTNPKKYKFYDNLGPLYYSVLANCNLMIGNSSSGIVEAASFKLPVVNIGNRQKGRVRGANVIDCDHNIESINNAISKAIDPRFKDLLSGISNPYKNKKIFNIALEIIKVIKSFNTSIFTYKKFYTIEK